MGDSKVVINQNDKYDEQMSENYLNYLDLKKNATTNELLVLTENKNPIVACYSGWALVERDYDKLTEIFIQFKNRKQTVTVANGDVLSKESLEIPLYFRYLNSIKAKDIPKDRTLFKLDSLIIFDNSSEEFMLQMALENREHQVSIFIEQIQNLAFQEKNLTAALFLSKLPSNQKISELHETLMQIVKNKKDYENWSDDFYPKIKKYAIKINDTVLLDFVNKKMD